MVKRSAIFWPLAALAAAAVAWMLWGLAAQRARHAPAVLPAVRPIRAAVAPDRDSAARWAEMEQVADAVRRNNVPIHFWGKAVDEEGHPLAGVEVRYSVRSPYELVPGLASVKFSSYIAQTDDDGLFEINGPRGDQLYIEALVKSGYSDEPAPGDAEDNEAPRQFRYAGAASFYHPDPTEPVIYALSLDEPAPPTDASDEPMP